MSAMWCHCNPLPASSSIAALPPEEAHHVAAVRRLSPGDTLTLFDGQGCTADATIASIAKKREVQVHVHDHQHHPPLTPAITLATALPKGDRQTTLIDMATQLGVNRIIPLICERSVVEPGEAFARRALRWAVEAAKQSHQPFLPIIDQAAPPAACGFACENMQSTPPTPTLIADPTGIPLSAALQSHPAAQHWAILIGPEGGFTPAELTTAQSANALTVTLGPSILRIETAALAALAVFRLTS